MISLRRKQLRVMRREPYEKFHERLVLIHRQTYLEADMRKVTVSIMIRCLCHAAHFRSFHSNEI